MPVAVTAMLPVTASNVTPLSTSAVSVSWVCPSAMAKVAPFALVLPRRLDDARAVDFTLTLPLASIDMLSWAVMVESPVTTAVTVLVAWL